MAITSDDRYHCKQVMGFFIEQNGQLVSPHFSMYNIKRQKVLVTVAPIENDVGARLAVIYRKFGRRRYKLLGFTDEKHESLYFYNGTLPTGKIHLVPVDGHALSESPRPNYQYENYVTLFQKVDGFLCYTRPAEIALEHIFVMLDADNNAYLSRREMAVFKKFLGFGHAITDDEWCDVLFGWEDGDLDSTLTEISCEFFKKFIIRLCDGQFVFHTASSKKKFTMIKNLENIFELFGFDKDLMPVRNSRYIIRIYSESWIPDIILSANERISTSKAIMYATLVLGKKKNNHKRKISIYTLHCCDWFSVVVKNYSDEPRAVMIDCSGSVGCLPEKSNIVWEEVMPEHSEMVMIPLENGFGLIEFHSTTAPVQNLP